MAAESSIEWTDATWNPLRGCRKVSPGCKNCYAEAFAERFKGVKGHPYELGFVPRLAAEQVALPLRWARPRRVFVNSMSDLFLEDFSLDYIAIVFGVMASCPQHTFQVLTKRASRMRQWFEWIETAGPAVMRGSRDPWTACVTRTGVFMQHGGLGPSSKSIRGFLRRDVDPPPRVWPLPNVWLGVSAEDQEWADARIPELLQTPAAVRFVSYEPALGSVELGPFLGSSRYVERLNWVIVGGESGPGARPFDIGWARNVVEDCKRANVACFVKQLGSKPVGLRLVDRKGVDPEEWPVDLRVRQYPNDPMRP